MNVKIEQSWNSKLTDEFNKPYFKELTDFVREEYSKTNILPVGLSSMPSISVRLTM